MVFGMQNIISRLVYYISWLAVILTCVVTMWWATVVAEEGGRGGRLGLTGMAFLLIGAIPLGGGILALAVIPSSILCVTKAGQRRDRISLLLAGTTFLAVLVEGSLLLFISPP
jgi:hypothetical protein